MSHRGFRALAARTAALVLLAAGIVAAHPAAGHAFALWHASDGDPIFWPDETNPDPTRPRPVGPNSAPIPVTINTANLPAQFCGTRTPSQCKQHFENLARQVLQDWEAVPWAAIRFTVTAVIDDPARAGFNSDGVNMLSVFTFACGVASLTYDDALGVIQEFDLGVTPGCMISDLETYSILAQEFGHGVGLEHTTMNNSLTPQTPEAMMDGSGQGPEALALTQDDKVGLAVLYPDPTNPLQAATATVKGRVLRHDDQTPVWGGLVYAMNTSTNKAMVSGYTGLTNNQRTFSPSGEFELPGLPPGSYRLVVSPLDELTFRESFIGWGSFDAPLPMDIDFARLETTLGALTAAQVRTQDLVVTSEPPDSRFIGSPPDPLALDVTFRFVSSGGSQLATRFDAGPYSSWSCASELRFPGYAYGTRQITSVPQGAHTFRVKARNVRARLGNIDTTTLGSELRIDGADRSALDAAFGATPSSANWNPCADLNKDQIIDGRDRAILDTYFGRSVAGQEETTPAEMSWVVGNRPPQLEYLLNETLTAGKLNVRRIKGSDPEGERLTMTASGLPSGATWRRLGDVTQDNTLTSQDADWIRDYLAKTRTFSAEQFWLADVSGDFKVDAGDEFLLRVAVEYPWVTPDIINTRVLLWTPTLAQGGQSYPVSVTLSDGVNTPVTGSLTLSVVRPNLVSNGGFEAGQTDWSGWDAARYLTNDNSYEGTKAVRISAGASTRSLTHTDIPVTAGATYRLAAAQRTSFLLTGGEAWVNLVWLKADGTPVVVNGATAIVNIRATSGATNWTVRQSSPSAAPAQAAKARITLYVSAGSGSADFDVVTLERIQ